MKQLSTAALAALGNAEVDAAAKLVKMPLVDRKLYLEIDTALQSIDGKWDKKRKGHVFPEDPTDMMDSLVTLGTYVRVKKTTDRTLFGFVETPEKMVDRLLDLAEIPPHTEMDVLEPSAGPGRIACKLARYVDVALTCVEIHPERASALEVATTPEILVHRKDFLDLTSLQIGRFDRTVMNPPFTMPGQRACDIDHVTHAFELLKPRGRLVTVMSGSTTYRTDKKTTKFRTDLLDRYGVHAEENPPETFKAEGTSIHTMTYVLVKR